MPVPLPPVPRVPDDAPDPSSSDAHPHEWEVAAVIRVTEAEAKLASGRRYHVIKIPEADVAAIAGRSTSRSKKNIGLKVNADDVYCRRCRVTWVVGAATICAATLDEKEKAHLIGGHQEERKKRKPLPMPPPQREVIPGEKFSRFGLDAFLDGHV